MSKKKLKLTSGSWSSLRKNTFLLLVLAIIVLFSNVIVAYSYPDNQSVSTEKRNGDPLQTIECNRARYEITIDAWGRIQVTDSYQIRNNGGGNVDNLQFQLPKGASSAEAYDYIGDLRIDSVGGGLDTTTYVTIYFRYPLRGSPYHDSYSFTLRYLLPAQSYVKQIDWLSHYRLSFDLFPQTPTGYVWTIRKLTVVINLPEGSNYESSVPAPERVDRNGLQWVIIYSFANIKVHPNFYLEIDYQYIVFWSAFRPTLWVSLTIIALSLIILFQRTRRPPTPLPLPVSVDLIRAFIGAVEEKIALRFELESLEEDLNRGKIKKKEYKKRKKSISLHMRSLTKEFNALKDKMEKAGPKYSEAIKKVEVAEAEYEAAKSALSKLERQYMRRRISKGAYEKLREKYLGRADKAKATIDEVTISLREEIR